MKVSEWLEKAGKLHKALELLIQEVSRQVHISENYQDLKFYLDTSLEENLDNGYLYRMQYATAYHGIPDIDVKYEREIRDMGASLGSDYTNLITLNLRHILALVLYGRGEFRRAQEILEHLVNELGAHPFSYHEKALLALTLYHQGEFGKAEKLQQELVEDAYFEPSHPDTITRVNNLAVTLCSQHRWDECVGLYLRTLELVRKKSSLGEEHPNVLTIKHNLAAAYLWQGKWVDSRRIQLETLEARKRVLGEDHRETMHSYTNLGVLYWEQGLREQALDYLEAVVAKSRRLWGARDRDTARYSLALAKYYLNLSRYYDVEELLRDYVEAFDRGETDLLILEKTLIVAEAMVRLEKHKSAERLISTIASKLPKVDYLTEITDQTLLTTALLLSRVYELQRRWAEVTKLQPRIIAYYKNLYGEQCTEIFETTIALGRALYHEGRFQEAEKLVSERITTLQCFRKTTDSTNVSYDLYFTKSDAQFELLQDIQIASGNFRKAREANEKLIDVRSVKFGVHHPLVFNAKAKAAWLLEQEELTEEANTLYSSTLEEARQQLGDDHYQALLLMVDLARTYRKQRDWTTSEKLCQEVVDRRANLRSPGLNYGSKSQLDAVYIIALSDLATSIYLQGRGEDAEQLQVTTLRLSNEIHGPEHFQTLIAMFNLAMTYKHKKSFAEYEKLLLKFLNIQKPRYFPKLRITPHVIGDLMAHYEECCRWNSVVDFYDDWVKHIRPELERKPLWIVSLHMCVLRSLAEQGKWGELEKRMREFILEHENSRRQTPIGTIQYHKMQLRSFFRQGKLSDAKEICWKCIELYQVGLVDRDPLPPDFLEAAHDLPAELATAGRIGEALSLQRQLLKISEKLHPKASITLTKREMLASLLQCSLYPAEGSIFSDNEDASLAELEAVFRAAIEERREMGLLDDPNTWETMKELGEFYIFVGRYPDALAMFVKRAKAVRMASNEANERHANDQGLERAIQIVSQVAYRLTQAGEQSQEEEGAALFQLLAEVSLQELGEGHQITRSCVLNAAMVNTTHPTANSSSA
ncbi:hypothetical protein EV426DRAFT_106463 [Tirmania nivea]|nr:hypothetical protein EV426DRAFT_106463 [Tirmania nivea]